VELEELEAPQALGLGGHRVDRPERLLVLGRGLGRAFLLVLFFFSRLFFVLFLRIILYNLPIFPFP